MLLLCSQRTATLNWPGLAEEEEEQQQEGAGRGSNAGSSSPLQHTSLLGAWGQLCKLLSCVCQASCQHVVMMGCGQAYMYR